MAKAKTLMIKIAHANGPRHGDGRPMPNTFRKACYETACFATTQCYKDEKRWAITHKGTGLGLPSLSRLMRAKAIACCDLLEKYFGTVATSTDPAVLAGFPGFVPVAKALAKNMGTILRDQDRLVPKIVQLDQQRRNTERLVGPVSLRTLGGGPGRLLATWETDDGYREWDLTQSGTSGHNAWWIVGLEYLDRHAKISVPIPQGDFFGENALKALKATCKANMSGWFMGHEREILEVLRYVDLAMSMNREGLL